MAAGSLTTRDGDVMSTVTGSVCRRVYLRVLSGDAERDQTQETNVETVNDISTSIPAITFLYSQNPL